MQHVLIDLYGVAEARVRVVGWDDGGSSTGERGGAGGRSVAGDAINICKASKAGMLQRL